MNLPIHRCHGQPAQINEQAGHPLYLLAALFAFALLARDVLAEEAVGSAPRKPLAGVSTACADCGVVRAIEEVRTERPTQRPNTYINSPQYLETRTVADSPLVGPAVRFTWGPGERTKAQIGAMGTPEMRQRFIEIIYRITVRFDDGRFGLIEQDDLGDLRVGDRVIVVSRRVEKVRE